MYSTFCTLLVCKAVFSFCLSVRLSSGPLGGRPYARLKAGTPREAPTPRTSYENTGPHNSESAQYEGRSNVESTNLARRADLATFGALRHR